jgi:hypothetical protein
MSAFGQIAQKVCSDSGAEKTTESGQTLRFDDNSFSGPQRVLRSG